MSGGNKLSKLHHYVPQAYLRGFGNDNSRIAVAPLDSSRKRFVSSARNIAAKKHFHTINELDEPDAFEKALSAVESEASKIIQSMLEDDFSLTEQDRWRFSYYMALQSVRGPDTRASIEHIAAEMTRIEIGAGGRKNVGRWIKDKIGVDASEADEERIWQEAVQPGGPPISFSNQEHIKHLLETAQELVVYFATRPWALVRFDRRSLVTSDAPVSLIANPEAEPWEGVGFQTAWGISFPITRKVGLLMSDPLAALRGKNPDDAKVMLLRENVLQGKLDESINGTTKMEKLFNENTAATAKEYIFYHPEDSGFVPSELPSPNLINLSSTSFEEMTFDGDPWFDA